MNESINKQKTGRFIFMNLPASMQTTCVWALAGGKGRFHESLLFSKAKKAKAKKEAKAGKKEVCFFGKQSVHVKGLPFIYAFYCTGKAQDCKRKQAFFRNLALFAQKLRCKAAFVWRWLWAGYTSWV